jgi:outer membrane receptor protein involved in Fe transport
MTSPRLRNFVAVALGFLFTFSLALAAPVKFDIPAQLAPGALKAFIAQSGSQVMFDRTELASVRTNAVQGEYEPASALAALLDGTGFAATARNDGIFVVKKSEAPVTTGSVKGSLTGEGGKGLPNVLVAIKETAQSTETDRYGVFAFPKVAAGTYVLVASAPGYQTMHITDVQVKAGRELTLGKEDMRKAGEGPLALEPFVVRGEIVEQLEKFIVTDTKPQPFSDRNVDLPRTINDVQPYYIFDSQKIEESGTTSVEDFLRQRLTMDTTVQTNAQKTRYSNQNRNAITSSSTASSINLNGLGANHTLILVNGLPMAGVTAFTGGITQPGQPDINGIPLGAIDRIEVLPSSAGAIYGAGAVGGVINIILKKAYNGGDITATYASTWDGHGSSHTLEATAGTSFERGKTQLFVTAQYSDASPMFVGDRINLYNRGYARLLQTAPDFVGYSPDPNNFEMPVGSTPNVMGIDSNTYVPINLTLKSTGASLGSPIATFPVGYSATSSPSTIIGGRWNTAPAADNEAPNGLFVPLGNYPRRKSIMATLTRQMTDQLQLHVDFSRTENHSSSTFNPIATAGGLYVPASAPVNPFNQDVLVSIPVNLNAPATSDSATTSITIGGTLKLPFDWVTHLDYQWSGSSFETSIIDGVPNTPFDFPASTFYALSSYFTYLGVPDNNPTPLWSGAVNPFVDTIAHPINWDPFTFSNHTSGKTTFNDLVIAASGPLYHLPWGDPRLSVRLEHVRTGAPQGATYATAPTGTLYPGLPADWQTYTSFSQSQSTDSANAQLDLPLFKSKLPLLHALDAQFNFSSEASTVRTGTPGIATFASYAYSSFPNGAVFLLSPTTLGNSNQSFAPFTDQFGNAVPASGAQPLRIKSVTSNTSITGPALSYKPTDDIIIRASIADGFVPPTYAQLVTTNYQRIPDTTMITDPQTGSVYNVATYSLGGNPNLKPQTSKSLDFGVIWEPQYSLLRGLRLNAEYTNTKQYNLILSPSPQTIVDFANNFPGLVVRDPTTGRVTSVATEYINVAEAKQEAWTFSIDYNWKTSIGSFELTGAESIQEHVQQQLVAGTNFLEFVGFPNSGGVAKTKATGTLRWAFRNWVAAWTVVNFGSYKQYGAVGDPGAYASQLEQGQPYTLYTGYTVAQGSNTIPSQTYHNLYLSYNFPKDPFDRASHWGRLTDAFLSGMKVSLVVNNVFNTVPPFDAFYPPFYTSPYGDVQLRNYAITLKKSF